MRFRARMLGRAISHHVDGFEARDADFLRRLRNLASEALTWPHLGARQRLVWAAAAELEAVPLQEQHFLRSEELPPWFWERRNLTHRHPGLDLLSLDGSHAVCCWNASVSFKEVRRFLRMSRWVYKAEKCTVVTSTRRFPKKVQAWLRNSGAEHRVITAAVMKRLAAADPLPAADEDGSQLPLRQCQHDCLEACAKGARVIEMACGSGKTRVIKELVSNTSGRVLITVPLRALLDQFAPDFPGFCTVGTGHNKKIDFDARGFIAVADSVHLLEKLKFQSIFVDEGHHPLPPKLPKSTELYRFSATHKEGPDFRYTMGQAIEDGVLCDYDITVPALTAHHAYVCLADLLLKQVGRFRRVLAYCNSVAEAKRFRMVLKKLGLAAWHINAQTPMGKRAAVIEELAGPLSKPVHILVTVEVLGEGINIPNADTCMFVEPRNSYRSIIQAIGRVLRHHPAKTLAHIVLPAVAIPSSKSSSMSQPELGGNILKEEGQQDSEEIPRSNSASKLGSKSKGQTIQEKSKQNVVRSCTHEASIETHHSAQLQSASDMIPVQELQQQEQNKMRTSTGTDLSADPKSDFQVESDVVPRRSSSAISASVPLTAVKPEVLVADSQKVLQDNFGAVGTSEEHWAPVVVRGGSNTGPRPDASAPIVDQGGEPYSRQPKPLQCNFSKQMEESQRVGGTVGFEEEIAHSENLEAPCQPVQPQEFSHQHPVPAWTPLNHQIVEERPLDISGGNATLRPKLRRSLKLKAPSGSPAFDQAFGSQLERFLATLMQADHRLVGAIAAHRIQIADCTLGDGGATMMEGWTAEIYGRLSVMLSPEDPWEVRLRNVEAFVKKHGRLPSSRAADYSERTLGVWLQDQGTAFRRHRMPLHRFHQLLASLPLVRRRAEGWQAGGADERFRENSGKLKEYLHLHGSLPTQCSCRKLAQWLANMQRRFGLLSQDKQKVLQEVDPLVKAEVKKWQNQKLRINWPLWERRLGELSEFVSRTKRLPRQTHETGRGDERRCYEWLRTQRRYLQAGILPGDLVQQLRDAHPLISEHLTAAVENAIWHMTWGSQPQNH